LILDWPSTGVDDADVEVVEGAGAPQIPALDLSLAILARSGPFAGRGAFWIPALALAADQSEPNTSTPDFDPDGFCPAEEVDVVDEKEEVEVIPGLLVVEERGWDVVGVVAVMEVK